MAYFIKILEYTFSGTKELKVVFFECDWFDPVNGIKVDDFGMVEVKRALFRQQTFVYTSSVVGVLPKLFSRKHDKLVQRQDDDGGIHVYQEEIKGHQHFTISDVELMKEESDHSKKRLQKSKRVAEKQERHEQLNACVIEADSDADDFW
jgi:hypothetical protein